MDIQQLSKKSFFQNSFFMFCPNLKKWNEKRKEFCVLNQNSFFLSHPKNEKWKVKKEKKKRVWEFCKKSSPNGADSILFMIFVASKIFENKMTPNSFFMLLGKSEKNEMKKEFEKTLQKNSFFLLFLRKVDNWKNKNEDFFKSCCIKSFSFFLGDWKNGKKDLQKWLKKDFWSLAIGIFFLLPVFGDWRMAKKILGKKISLGD